MTASCLVFQIDSDEVKSLVKFLVQVYEQLEDETMVMVAFTGRDKSSRPAGSGEPDLGDLNKGKCFLKLKSAEMDSLESQVKELYTKIKLVN